MVEITDAEILQVIVSVENISIGKCNNKNNRIKLVRNTSGMVSIMRGGKRIDYRIEK